MNCNEARRELALHAGEDLGDPQREAEIRQHLTQCPACRRRHAGVKSALAALAVPEMSSTYESVHSLWPALRRRIAQGEGSTAAGQSWQAAAPTIAGLVVCAGLMLSTAILLRRPAVHQAPVEIPASSLDYQTFNRLPLRGPGTHGEVRPAVTNPEEDAPPQTPRSFLMRKIAVPQE